MSLCVLLKKKLTKKLSNKYLVNWITVSLSSAGVRPAVLQKGGGGLRHEAAEHGEHLLVVSPPLAPHLLHHGLLQPPPLPARPHQPVPHSQAGRVGQQGEQVGQQVLQQLVQPALNPPA